MTCRQERRQFRGDPLARGAAGELPPFGGQVRLVGVPAVGRDIGKRVPARPDHPSGPLEPADPGEILGAEADFGSQPGRQVAPGPADLAGDVADPAPAAGTDDQPPGPVKFGRHAGGGRRRSRRSSHRRPARPRQQRRPARPTVRRPPVAATRSASSSTSPVSSPAGSPNSARAANGWTASWMPRCRPVPSTPAGGGSSTGRVCRPPTGIANSPDRLGLPTGISMGNGPDSENTSVRYGLGRPRCTPPASAASGSRTSAGPPARAAAIGAAPRGCRDRSARRWS